jgi:SAM-dependent methyltransferase
MGEGFKDHFSARSAQYALYRPSYSPALAGWLAELAPSRALAVDCGCGAGQLSTVLAEAFERVVALDASAQQIAHAAPHPRVEYRVARGEATGVAAASADLVTVAQAAHWFDLEPFYAEVRRILRPRGVIALVTYGVVEADGAVGEIMRRFYYEDIGGFWPPERRHVETGYRLLPFPFEEEGAAPALAMTAQWRLEDLLGYVDTWSAVRAAEKALGAAPCQRLAADLRAVWGAPEERREIRWPLSLRVGRV